MVTIASFFSLFNQPYTVWDTSLFGLSSPFTEKVGEIDGVPVIVGWTDVFYFQPSAN